MELLEHARHQSFRLKEFMAIPEERGCESHSEECCEDVGCSQINEEEDSCSNGMSSHDHIYQSSHNLEFENTAPEKDGYHKTYMRLSGESKDESLQVEPRLRFQSPESIKKQQSTRTSHSIPLSNDQIRLDKHRTVKAGHRHHKRADVVTHMIYSAKRLLGEINKVKAQQDSFFSDSKNKIEDEEDEEARPTYIGRGDLVTPNID